MEQFRNRVIAALGLIVLLSVSGLLTARSGSAQQGGGWKPLEDRVAALETAVKDLQDANTSLTARAAALESTDSAQQAAISALQSSLSDQAGVISKLKDALSTETGRAEEAETKLSDRASSLEHNTQFISVNDSEGDTYLTGTNLHIVNGLGATNGNPAGPNSLDPSNTHVNGKGNLIVGYNLSRSVSQWGVGPDIRTGSHNIIVGDQLNYSSFGGIVTGFGNTTSGPFSSVAGGAGNTASGWLSSVGGGTANTAGGLLSSVSGGNSVTQGDMFGWSGGIFHSP